MTKPTLEMNGIKKEFNSLRELGAYTLLIQSMGYALQYSSRGEDIPEDLLQKIHEKTKILLNK